MKWVKTFKLEIITLPILALVFFASRIINIMSLPLFTDEAIYSRWAQIAKFDPNWRFISLTDGKQPLFVWLDVISMKIFDDPLLAGRLVSVGAGFLALIGVYFLASELFKNRKIGIITSILFVFFPFALVYDRMALYDSLVAAFFVWALYFQVILVRKLRLDIAMIVGFVIGASVLNKSSGFLSIYLAPLLLTIFDFSKKGLKSRLIKFAVLILVGIVIAYGMYSILRLSPFFHIIDEKNNNFVYTLKDWLDFTFMSKINNFISNGRGLLDWFLTYFTIPYLILVIGSFYLNRKFLREKIVLVLWFLAPFLLLCLFGKTLYPRYVLFMTMPLLPLVAYSLYYLHQKYKNGLVMAIIILLAVILPLRIDYYVLFDFPHAPIPALDLEQYINGWPAGGGVKESVEYFANQAKQNKIYIATQGTFGLMPASYEMYFYDNKNVVTKGYWPTNEEIPEEILKAAKIMPTYVVFYQECRLCAFPGAAPTTWPLDKVQSYRKGTGDTYLTVYKVRSE